MEQNEKHFIYEGNTERNKLERERKEIKQEEQQDKMPLTDTKKKLLKILGCSVRSQKTQESGLLVILRTVDSKFSVTMQKMLYI